MNMELTKASDLTMDSLCELAQEQGTFWRGAPTVDLLEGRYVITDPDEEYSIHVSEIVHEMAEVYPERLPASAWRPLGLPSCVLRHLQQWSPSTLVEAMDERGLDIAKQMTGDEIAGLFAPPRPLRWFSVGELVLFACPND